MIIEDVAKVAHEINKAFCESNGDFSQKDWDQSPQWQKDSAINGVKFHLSNPGSLPEDSHNSWLEEKESNGWVYGETKDADKKTHPCCLPFSELSREHKSKDYLFCQVVKSLRGFLFSGK